MKDFMKGVGSISLLHYIIYSLVCFSPVIHVLFIYHPLNLKTMIMMGLGILVFSFLTFGKIVKIISNKNNR